MPSWPDSGLVFWQEVQVSGAAGDLLGWPSHLTAETPGTFWNSSLCPCPGFLSLRWATLASMFDHCQEAVTAQAEAQVSGQVKYISLKCRFLEGPRLLVSPEDFFP